MRLADVEFIDGSVINWSSNQSITTTLKNTKMQINTGLNWIGTCANVDCSQNDIRAVSNRGLGQFEICDDVEEHAICPECSDPLDVDSFGLYRWAWSYKGRLESTGEWDKSKEKLAVEECELHTFENLTGFDIRFLEI